jgi:hypothetical protein
MADMRDEEDRLWEVRSKGINYLLIAHGAGLVACLTLVKDIDNAPKLKGLGPVIALFGVGLMSAIMGIANLYSWRQAQLRGREEELWRESKVFYLVACPVSLSLGLLFIIIIVAIVKFGNL